MARPKSKDNNTPVVPTRRASTRKQPNDNAASSSNSRNSNNSRASLSTTKPKASSSSPVTGSKRKPPAIVASLTGNSSKRRALTASRLLDDDDRDDMDDFERDSKVMSIDRQDVNHNEADHVDSDDDEDEMRPTLNKGKEKAYEHEIIRADENNEEDDGDDDDEGEEWEEVGVEALETESCQQDDNEEDEDERSGPWQYNAVEIVFQRPPEESATPVRGKGITKEDRMIRILIHQTHLLCLIANGQIRNRWINHPKIQSIALSLVPGDLANPFQKLEAESAPVVFDHSHKEIAALTALVKWWKDIFEITSLGIQNREFIKDEMVPFGVVDSQEDVLKRRKDLQRRLKNLQGSTDVCAQLFTAVCRSLGMEARLIESLQPCPFKMSMPPKTPTTSSGSGASTAAPVTTGSTKTSTLRRKKPLQPIDESDTTRGSITVTATPHRMVKKPVPGNSSKPEGPLPHSHRQSPPPVFWTEVYSTLLETWIPIDPIRGFVHQANKMFPGPSCKHHRLSYVVAYDHQGYLTDVTRRYTKQWASVTNKLRIQPAGTFGFDWWNHTLRLLQNPLWDQRAEKESAELLQNEGTEGIPTRISDFNNHPLYALERHLKQREIIYPLVPVLGHVRGEPIYPRRNIRQVKSKEQWIKQAKVVKQDAVPVKWVAAKAATVKSMRMQLQSAVGGGDESDEGNSDTESTISKVSTGGGGGAGTKADLRPLFGDWQTELYQPPTVSADGRVPRNEFGQVNVFTPAMVPIGGTHLPHRNIAKVARQLGVDYVEAVTGFDFLNRRSVPRVEGIVVPTESAEMVMDAYHEVNQFSEQQVAKKKSQESLKLWRKMILGVMIRARLRDEYGDLEEEEALILDDEDGEEGDVRVEKMKKKDNEVVEPSKVSRRIALIKQDEEVNDGDESEGDDEEEEEDDEEEDFRTVKPVRRVRGSTSSFPKVSSSSSSLSSTSAASHVLPTPPVSAPASLDVPPPDDEQFDSGAGFMID